MAHLSTYRTSIHAGFGASIEVLAAIETVAGDDILDAGSNAARIWADPTPAEQDAVLTAAWALAHSDDDVLFWGGSHYRI
jgi:hypothetical protein